MREIGNHPVERVYSAFVLWFLLSMAWIVAGMIAYSLFFQFVHRLVPVDWFLWVYYPVWYVSGLVYWIRR